MLDTNTGDCGKRCFHTCYISENSEMEVLECSWPILVRSKMTTVVSFWSILMMGSSFQLIRDAFLLRWRGICSACDGTGSDYHKIYVIAPAKICLRILQPNYHKEVLTFSGVIMKLRCSTVKIALYLLSSVGRILEIQKTPVWSETGPNWLTTHMKHASLHNLT